MSDEPTNGEIMRRVDDLARQMARLVDLMESDRKTNGETYLRGEVYRAERTADRAEVAAVIKRLEAADATRRQYMLGVAISVTGMLITGALSVSNLLARLA